MRWRRRARARVRSLSYIPSLYLSSTLQQIHFILRCIEPDHNSGSFKMCVFVHLCVIEHLIFESQGSRNRKTTPLFSYLSLKLIEKTTVMFTRLNTLPPVSEEDN